MKKFHNLELLSLTKLYYPKRIFRYFGILLINIKNYLLIDCVLLMNISRDVFCLYVFLHFSRANFNKIVGYISILWRNKIGIDLFSIFFITLPIKIVEYMWSAKYLNPRLKVLYCALCECSKIALMHNDLNTTRTILLIYDFSETTGWVPTHKVAAFTSLFRVNTRELTLICRAR